MSQAGKGEEERAEHARSHRGALKSCSNGNCFVKTANCQLACCLRVLGGGGKAGWKRVLWGLGMCLEVVLGTLRLPRELQIE